MNRIPAGNFYPAIGIVIIFALAVAFITMMQGC